MHKQLWIGLAEVHPLPECKLLEEARGAYVHAMAWANDPDEFRMAVRNRAADLALELVELRETEPWFIRNSGEDPIRDEFYDMAERVKTDVSLVAFGRFHAWFQDQPIGEKRTSTVSSHQPEKNASSSRPSTSPPER